MIFESSYGVVAIRVTTGVPCPKGAETISVYIESLMPVVTAAGVSVRPLNVHTVFDVAELSLAVVPPNRARTSAEGWNCSAAAGTRSTLSRRATSIDTRAVMPGFNCNRGLAASIIAV